MLDQKGVSAVRRNPFLIMGMEKGMEKLLVAFMKKNPSLTDHQIASSFDVSIALVKKIRLAMSDQN